ncbi:LPS export ABC transporter periplasmic protein LptC [Parahaliea aestuarii]|uniref:LPS export ABC transporter periplasmic protein LptC n=1 Tax=Parahaliea aestuarii TaxID=1852021 RepID=A0A5C9A6T0_9GAMM|nr:LPS export ABC transporter periplasmic protein LptC [Parahaliea aestuarii]TXS94901.1 LPS export ABC transporter periplasmic protein LptC [Parahaliea aestuarii]
MQRTALPIALALFLVLLTSLYWNPGGDPAADPAIAQRQMTLPRTYVEEVRSWQYAANGNLKEVLEADRAEYFTGKDASELTQPRFYSHDGNDRSWSASADEGTFRHRAGILQLRRQVRLVNDQTGGTLATQAMTLNTRKNTAISRVPVTVTQNESILRADGMTADLNSERIVMSPNVETTYVQARP